MHLQKCTICRFLSFRVRALVLNYFPIWFMDSPRFVRHFSRYCQSSRTVFWWEFAREKPFKTDFVLSVIQEKPFFAINSIFGLCKAVHWKFTLVQTTRNTLQVGILPRHGVFWRQFGFIQCEAKSELFYNLASGWLGVVGIVLNSFPRSYVSSFRLVGQLFTKIRAPEQPFDVK